MRGHREEGIQVAGMDRKKQLARQRYERQQQRRAVQERQARRVKVIGGVTAIVLLGGAGAGVAVAMSSDDEPKAKTPEAAATPTPQPAVKPGECGYLDSPDQGAPKGLGKPPVKPAYKGNVTATVKTNLGDVKVSLDAAKAPCTVASFAYLAGKNYFDKTQCHRLTTGSLQVLQCGDPTGSGAGGPGYRFANENTTGAKYTRGVLAMAHSQQPDSNGSQFFIVYGDSKDLPADYTVFGKVTSGLDVIDEVAKAGSDNSGGTGDGKPKKKIEINDVTITKK
ncbi:peptidylprolyl isomerase [Actinomadura scrupuli]|uniref:peptidylprolyl isomerase n=1 Tax=Actinomadura scrupuli TaxID=559629 RepID=UPI003D962BFB